MNSVLFPGVPANKVRTYPAKALVNEWANAYGMDVSRFFAGLKEIHEYQCSQSGIYFYHPASLAGDGPFYGDLMKYSWYYLPDKWEYDTTLSLLKAGTKLLEIGSGSGVFVQKCWEQNILATGLELNEAAVLTAQQKGLPVLYEDLLTIASSNEGAFDAVVNFQVLEHIADPLPFLKACVSCLKPGGILLVSVPNADLPLIRRHSILNAPPHHMLGWTAKSFRSLEQILPVSLQEVLCEPLSELHIDWYLGVMQQTSFLARQWLRWPVLKSLTRYFLQGGGRRWVKGHSHLAWYKKVNL